MASEQWCDDMRRADWCFEGPGGVMCKQYAMKLATELMMQTAESTKLDWSSGI